MKIILRDLISRDEIQNCDTSKLKKKFPVVLSACDGLQGESLAPVGSVILCRGVATNSGTGSIRDLFCIVSKKVV